MTWQQNQERLGALAADLANDTLKLVAYRAYENVLLVKLAKPPVEIVKLNDAIPAG
jgi:hypothetical protein